jgi:hypothetical protein
MFVSHERNKSVLLLGKNNKTIWLGDQCNYATTPSFHEKHREFGLCGKILSIFFMSINSISVRIASQ